MLPAKLQRLLLAHTLIEEQLYPPLKLPVRFRGLTAADYEPCLSIYRQNATDRFPPDNQKEFEECLRNESKNFVVAEMDSRVVGFGGIHLANPQAAVLFYGMLAPEHQRQRIGATLVLLRLAQLPPQPAGYYVFIFAVESSLSIYERFGFLRMNTGWPDNDGRIHPIGLLQISPDTLTKIRSRLARRAVRLEGALSLQCSAESRCEIERTADGLRVDFGPRHGAESR